MNNNIKNLLADYGFKPNEIKVYLALTTLGEAPASKIAKKANLPRTTAISLLEKMADEHLVSAHRYRGITSYWIEAPHQLKEKLQNKLKIAEQLSDLLTELYHSEADFPTAEIHDSKNSVKKFIEKKILSLPKNTTIFTIDTPGAGNYEKIFSEKIGLNLFEMKKKKNILTKTLIPFGNFEKINQQKLQIQNIFIKEMPKEIDFQASLWLLPNELVLFSGKYPFIVSAKHKIITQSIKSIFDFLWQISSEKK
ncbi:MAG: helix-turn-helix domain-containing protein [Patescibacteria group bacterium]